MKASQHTAEQIIKILEQAEKGDQTIGAVCRTNGIAENTFYRWRKTYGGMAVSEVQRLKELEKEHTRLKRLLAERKLEVDALKELLGKRSMSIPERREAVRFLVTRRVSVHRACVLVQLQRATFRYQPRPVVNDGVAAELRALAQEQPRYGYRRMWALLRRKRVINPKRVHRLWKRAGLQVQRPKHRRQRRERPMPLVAAYPSHVWAYDFVEDRDIHDNVLRILTVMDAFTREGLAIDVDLTTSAERVISVLTQLVAIHGTPDYLRSDNGSEFVALAVQAWLTQRQITTLYIDPGCPWQNGKDERFNGTVRDECLNMHLFVSVREARVRLEAFRRHYNEERPHSRLGYQTPSEFKQSWHKSQANEPDSHIPT